MEQRVGEDVNSDAVLRLGDIDKVACGLEHKRTGDVCRFTQVQQQRQVERRFSRGDECDGLRHTVFGEVEICRGEAGTRWPSRV